MYMYALTKWSSTCTHAIWVDSFDQGLKESYMYVHKFADLLLFCNKFILTCRNLLNWHKALQKEFYGEDPKRFVNVSKSSLNSTLYCYMILELYMILLWEAIYKLMLLHPASFEENCL